MHTYIIVYLNEKDNEAGVGVAVGKPSANRLAVDRLPELYSYSHSWVSMVERGTGICSVDR
jgi:hypothetical protein